MITRTSSDLDLWGQRSWEGASCYEQAAWPPQRANKQPRDLGNGKNLDRGSPVSSEPQREPPGEPKHEPQREPLDIVLVYRC